MNVASRIGIAAGNVCCNLVGGHGRQWKYVCSGGAFDALSAAMCASGRGEVAICENIAVALKSQCLADSKGR